jgi:hypothetical protein
MHLFILKHALCAYHQPQWRRAGRKLVGNFTFLNSAQVSIPAFDVGQAIYRNILN